MNEQVKLKLSDSKGAFYIEINGKQEAMMTFVFSGEDKIIIDHTEVNEGNNGKGFGNKMVQEAVFFARERGIKIVPLCPFAKHVFEKTPSYNDVLAI
ncbi:GNAT family N-acetyltransferase [Flavobacterium sp.]|jgi:predicted GNAT family acetyltransferase|uniref:GNAT family N-acetyltransferase n=1 Tax=Flavobacterium sp. TaxID=239 RepID=UPI0037C0BD1C